MTAAETEQKALNKMKIADHLLIGVVSLVVANAGLSVWWASQVTEKQRAQQEQINEHSADINNLEIRQNQVGELLARIEERSGYQLETLKRIEGKIEQK